MQKIKKGDMVEVIAGKDLGKRGKVLAVFPSEGKVRVEGIAIHHRHLKPGANPNQPNGGVVTRPSKIAISNVKFYSEKLGAAVRVGFEKNPNSQNKHDRYIRVARGKEHNGAELD